ncbi:MAG: TniB family NTP-binding protein [Pseudobdellovibrionaceae bacterium]|nr:TniB family NTP-binding protein [Pseudobdellovibrionaceae bacterium]
MGLLHWIAIPFKIQANSTLATLASLIEHPGRTRIPNFLIIGPTNNGKTMIIEKFRRMHPPSVSPGHKYDLIPVVAMQMPAEPTTSRFYAAILNTLNMPDLGIRTTTAFEQATIRTLKYVRTKVLIIDEIHNLHTGSVSKQREFLNLLRFIGNELRLAIVAAGTKDAYLAIRTEVVLRLQKLSEGKHGLANDHAARE